MPSLMDAVLSLLSQFLGWMTPRQQMRYLREKRDYQAWEVFRDGLICRWTNSNILCGLIMGATSTILFSSLQLSPAPVALGVASLLSSLLSIGFGVGHIYVLGDVRGPTLFAINCRYPRLFVFALSIPQVWATLSFVTFFLATCIFGWEATNKGWVIKMGIVTVAVLCIGHLTAFGYLLRSHDNAQYLIPDRQIGGGDEPSAPNSGSIMAIDVVNTGRS